MNKIAILFSIGSHTALADCNLNSDLAKLFPENQEGTGAHPCAVSGVLADTKTCTYSCKTGFIWTGETDGLEKTMTCSGSTASLPKACVADACKDFTGCTAATTHLVKKPSGGTVNAAKCCDANAKCSATIPAGKAYKTGKSAATVCPKAVCEEADCFEAKVAKCNDPANIKDAGVTKDEAKKACEAAKADNGSFCEASTDGTTCLPASGTGAKCDVPANKVRTPITKAAAIAACGAITGCTAAADGSACTATDNGSVMTSSVGLLTFLAVFIQLQ